MQALILRIRFDFPLLQANQLDDLRLVIVLSEFPQPHLLYNVSVAGRGK